MSNVARYLATRVVSSLSPLNGTGSGISTMSRTRASVLLTEEGARDLAARVLPDVKTVLAKPDTDP